MVEIKTHYVVFFPPNDKDIKANILRWLGKNKGELPLGDLECRLLGRFDYVSKGVYTGDQIRLNPRLKELKSCAYRFFVGSNPTACCGNSFIT